MQFGSWPKLPDDPLGGAQVGRNICGAVIGGLPGSDMAWVRLSCSKKRKIARIVPPTKPSRNRKTVSQKPVTMMVQAKAMLRPAVGEGHYSRLYG